MNCIILLLLFSLQAFGHGKVKHDGEAPKAQTIVGEDSLKAAYESRNTSYKVEIEPIFKNKCFDCHSGQTKYPWYYKIPGVNTLINYHIKEGRSHIDMDKGYPLQGHGTPLDDLNEIEKSVKDNSMPPLYYRVFHRESSLSNLENDTILNWVKTSRKKIKDSK